MLLNDINLVDRISVPTQRIITDNGQMIVPCAFARTGVQLYTAKQLGLQDREPNEIIEVHRESSDVFAADSMASFRSAPVTIGHPRDASGNPVAVTIDNAKDLQVGMLEGMPKQVEDTLSGVLVLTDKVALDALDEISELSAGYKCDIEVIDGKYFQRNIKANHIAIVGKGRAGSSCRISDDADEVILAMEDAAQMEATANVVAVEDSKTPNKDAVEALSMLLADAGEAKVLAVTALDEAAKAHELVLVGKDKEIADVKLELASAIKINDEAVIERCEVIEHARFVADMTDFGSKSIHDIRVAVLDNQRPDVSVEGKSEDYVTAMFDMMVSDSKKETPMGNLLNKQMNDAGEITPSISKVEEARNKSIKRNS